MAPAAQATVPAHRPAAHHPTEPRTSAAYALPGDRAYPEAITADPRTGTLYAGSYADGTVYRTTGRVGRGGGTGWMGRLSWGRPGGGTGRPWRMAAGRGALEVAPGASSRRGEADR
ncbi:hypothetical protein [Streptomyces sp. NPDC048636]|uniref:hypothetical protein n=1 Tax=Streptomyces sp. NPDC048636 TaxID=3155762 RepID=UPI00343243C6